MRRHFKKLAILLLVVLGVVVTSAVVYRNTEAGKIAYHRKAYNLSTRLPLYAPRTFREYVSWAGMSWLWDRVSHFHLRETLNERGQRLLKARKPLLEKHRQALMDLGYLKPRTFILNSKFNEDSEKFRRLMNLGIPGSPSFLLQHSLSEMDGGKTEVIIWTSDMYLPMWEHIIKSFNTWLEEYDNDEREPDEIHNY